MSDFWLGVTITAIIYFCVWVVFRTYDKERKKAKENEDFLVAAEGGVYTLNELRRKKGLTPYTLDPNHLREIRIKDAQSDYISELQAKTPGSDAWFDSFDPDRNRMAMPKYDGLHKHCYEVQSYYDPWGSKYIYVFKCRHCQDTVLRSKIIFWRHK